MTVTDNLGLKKPGGSDKVLISDLNTNADKLDEIIGKLSELDTSQKNSLVAAINAALLDTSESADAAAASAAAAEQSKTAAAESAAAAESSTTAAATAKNDAVTAKTAAETAKTDAVAAKTAAESASASATESKTAAASSAATATEKATAAANSATAAASSATAAQQSADSAEASVTGAVKYNTSQTLTVAQKEQAQKNIGVTWPCNPNLLDNWYFGNPVNQRGGSSYTGSYIYGIDRWRQAGITYNVAAGAVTPDSAADAEAKMFQMVACKSNEIAMTLSVLCDKGLFSVTSPAGGTTAGTAVSLVEFGRMILWDVAADSDFRYAELRFDSATMQTTTLIAVKLELGSEQTLAHQDANGNWVLNEIPDYGEQLARCRRYYRKAIHAMFPACAPQAGYVTFGVDISGMRTSPVVTDAQVQVQAFLNGKSYISDSVSIVPLEQPEEGYMSVQVSNVPANSSGTIVISTFELSADL